jgi:hypothetical protein
VDRWKCANDKAVDKAVKGHHSILRTMQHPGWEQVPELSANPLLYNKLMRCRRRKNAAEMCVEKRKLELRRPGWCLQVKGDRVGAVVD